MSGLVIAHVPKYKTYPKRKRTRQEMCAILSYSSSTTDMMCFLQWGHTIPAGLGPTARGTAKLNKLCNIFTHCYVRNHFLFVAPALFKLLISNLASESPWGVMPILHLFQSSEPSGRPGSSSGYTYNTFHLTRNLP